MKIEIKIHNIRDYEVPADEIKELVKKIWQSESRLEAVIDVILVDNERIQKLNQQFLHKNSATDVIAFPIDEGEGLFEGEIYISVEQVMKNASEYSVPFEDEFKRMVVHGILHFLGYDDKTVEEKQSMTHREDYYLSFCNHINY